MKREEYLFGTLRILMGWIFLWAFLDKLFGLGFATTSDKSWLLGNSPTSGFLSFGTHGPFAFIFQSLAGNAFVDWIFMIGLLLIGVALILGVAKRLSCYGGMIMLLFMWLAALPPENNPVIDEHIIYGFVLIFLAHLKTAFSLEGWWNSLSVVKRGRWLK